MHNYTVIGKVTEDKSLVMQYLSNFYFVFYIFPDDGHAWPKDVTGMLNSNLLCLTNSQVLVFTEELEISKLRILRKWTMTRNLGILNTTISFSISIDIVLHIYGATR
jgi:hypothetical protein